MRLALTAAVLLAAGALQACGDDGAAPRTAAAPSIATIAIEDFLYSPTPATVRAGATIRVRNADSAPHTLTDRATRHAFDSGTITGGATGSVTFTTPGTYAYFCEFHPYMKGTVTVTG